MFITVGAGVYVVLSWSIYSMLMSLAVEKVCVIFASIAIFDTVGSVRVGRFIVITVCALLLFPVAGSYGEGGIDFGSTHELNQPGFYIIDGLVEPEQVKLVDLKYGHEIPLTGDVSYEGSSSKVFTPELPDGSYELSWDGGSRSIDISGRYSYTLKDVEGFFSPGVIFVLLVSLVILVFAGRLKGRARVGVGFGMVAFLLFGLVWFSGSAGGLPSSSKCDYESMEGEEYLGCIMPIAYEVAFKQPSKLGDFVKRSEKSALCHEYSHLLGFETFRKDLSLEAAFQRASTVCGLGLIHGTTEAIAVYNSDEDYPNVIKEFCGKFEDLNVRDLCMHGGGHATVMRTGGNIIRALELCDALSGGDITCVSPALMEWSVWYLESPDRELAKERLQVPDEPFALCLTVDSDSRVRAGCYEGLSMLYQDSTDKLVSWCNESDPGFEVECLASIGKNAFYFFDKGGEVDVNDALKVGLLCKAGASGKAINECIYELARVFSFGGNEERTLMYCAKESELYRAACLRGRESSISESARLSNA